MPDQSRGLSTQYPACDGGQLLQSRAAQHFSVKALLIDTFFPLLPTENVDLAMKKTEVSNPSNFVFGI